MLSLFILCNICQCFLPLTGHIADMSLNNQLLKNCTVKCNPAFGAIATGRTVSHFFTVEEILSSQYDRQMAWVSHLSGNHLTLRNSVTEKSLSISPFLLANHFIFTHTCLLCSPLQCTDSNCHRECSSLSTTLVCSKPTDHWCSPCSAVKVYTQLWWQHFTEGFSAGK